MDDRKNRQATDNPYAEGDILVSKDVQGGPFKVVKVKNDTVVLVPVTGDSKIISDNYFHYEKE